MPKETVQNSSSVDPFHYRRRATREVRVGSVGVGGTNPIRLQSMTITSTMDTRATVDQTKRLVDAGCEIVRITAPTIREARNLEKIKNTLLKEGCTVPLVADIHFRPDAALEAANWVEKVRINPGNYADAKAFKIREYSDTQYEEELRRIEEKFAPLVEKLKKLNRALRIGTNHGSLSDRIMNRYGDTPIGMVESALEFTRICRRMDFHDIIFSMKASNPRVMVAAYRMLATALDEQGWDYPFHLGVTEAGDGEDGRIKSAVGIGSLLEDGIGDTVRVSLTEDPEYEIPVAREIAGAYGPTRTQVNRSSSYRGGTPYVTSRTDYARRSTRGLQSGPISVGAGALIRVASRINVRTADPQEILDSLEQRLKTDTPVEILIVEGASTSQEKYQALRRFLDAETSRLSYWVSVVPETTLDLEADGWLVRLDSAAYSSEAFSNWLKSVANATKPMAFFSHDADVVFDAVKEASRLGIVALAGLSAESVAAVQPLRGLVSRFNEARNAVSIWLESARPDLRSAAVLGSLICDGIGDVITIGDSLSEDGITFSYNLLQACGSRLTKTEYVSCPSCGRTLFDLQSTTERIKSKTGHLKGVKIAIMGCIVNGPGEMADADFGYVGGGPGKINLYVGKTCVEKSIPATEADERLIHLIKTHGRWVDPREPALAEMEKK